jgi:hypothetical protein
VGGPNFGGATGSNNVISSVEAALTQQKALQDPQEEFPFTAKQLQRDLLAQTSSFMQGLFKKPVSAFSP